MLYAFLIAPFVIFNHLNMSRWAFVPRPALRQTQSTIQWVPGVLSLGVKRGRGVTLTTHPHTVPRSRVRRIYMSSPPFRLHDGSGTALTWICEESLLTRRLMSSIIHKENTGQTKQWFINLFGLRDRQKHSAISKDGHRKNHTVRLWPACGLLNIWHKSFKVIQWAATIRYKGNLSLALYKAPRHAGVWRAGWR
jgi:hypothetical protein